MQSPKEQGFEWEAFFFIPTSLRIDAQTYGEAAIQSDLQSYVRFAVPRIPFGELVEAPLSALGAALAGSDDALTMRELRLFACHVRAAGVREFRDIRRGLVEPGSAPSLALARSARMIGDATCLSERLTGCLQAAAARGEDVAWISALVAEDVSKVLETLLGSLSRELGKAGAPRELRQAATEAAVEEPRRRRAGRPEGLGGGKLDKGEVEHLEFRRHVLKRITSSVLWLQPELRQPGELVKQLLYALAAGVAMAFALIAAFANGLDVRDDRIWIWSSVAVLAYAAKDRIKASLQNVFRRFVSQRFPNRRWLIRDAERGVALGKVDEQSGFVRPEALPEPSLALRRITRGHPIEYAAHPESILRHHRMIRLRPDRIAEADPRFTAITEIFRLDLRNWLAHTDNPNREILYADPEAGRIRAAMAPRVYNINVVYRLRRAGAEDVPWRRVRVVVGRKGIHRIDPIPDSTPQPS